MYYTGNAFTIWIRSSNFLLPSFDKSYHINKHWQRLSKLQLNKTPSGKHFSHLQVDIFCHFKFYYNIRNNYSYTGSLGQHKSSATKAESTGRGEEGVQIHDFIALWSSLDYFGKAAVMPYTTAGAMLLPKGSKKKIGPSRATIFLLYDNTTALTPHPLSSFFSKSNYTSKLVNCLTVWIRTQYQNLQQNNWVVY